MSSLCTLHVLSLSSSIDAFVSALRSTGSKPIFVTRVLGWVARPHKHSTLTLGAADKKWDLVIVFPNTEPLPEALSAMTKAQWSIVFASAEDVSSFPERNRAYMQQQPGSFPAVAESGPVTAETAAKRADLEFDISPTLDEWFRSTIHGPDGGKPVSMVNLLAFVPGQQQRYMQYVTGFASTFGPKYAAEGKLFGPAVAGQKEENGEAKAWEFVAAVHYPSLLHFREMILSDEYAHADRTLKAGSVDENPLMACVDLEF